MKTRIICKFKNQESLDSFCKNNNFDGINQYTKVYNVHTKDSVQKRQSIKKESKDKQKYWETQWIDMPYFHNIKIRPFAKIEFIFNEEDNDLAKKIFEQNITDKTISIWYPKREEKESNYFRVVGGNLNPQFPFYVVSKGRWNRCYTSIYLSQMNQKHYVVVEPDEVEKYRKELNNKYVEILPLDMSYKDNYDTCDDLGDTKGKGPGGARNFCWEHSIKNGYSHHWVFDDNADTNFFWMYKNMELKVKTPALFRSCEDFVLRYKNIAISGLNYECFVKSIDAVPAFVLNTRIYSFLLIRNDIPYRWRGRYNEDTDLSLRALKDGWCTVQFNHLLAGKCTTQRMNGGNTEEFYKKDGTYDKSDMLVKLHPDLARHSFKFHREHHYVDYSVFTQKLQYKDEYNNFIKPKINNYGTKIIKIDNVEYNGEKDEFENGNYQEISFEELDKIEVYF